MYFCIISTIGGELLSTRSRKRGKIINKWQKHSKAIKKSKAKTVKDLVARLRPGAGREPSIEGVNKSDAAEMLIDIGLSVLPCGLMFRHEVRKHFKGAHEKVNFKNVLSALEKISKEKGIEERTRSYLRSAIAFAKSSRVKDPFKEETPLKKYPFTAPIFTKTILDGVAKVLKLKEEEITKLRRHYSSRDQFMNSTSADIHAATGIALGEIDKFKAILHWTEIDISVNLANALATMSLKKADTITLNSQELKDIVEKSGVAVPAREKTDKQLKKVIASARAAVPDLTYYTDVISSFKLPKEAKSFLKEKKVQSFGDLRRNGLIKEFIDKGKIKDKDAERLQGFCRLEKVTYNPTLSNALINDGVQSVYALSRIPREEFIKKHKKLSKKDELLRTHRKAVEIAGKNFGVTAWAYLASRGLNVDSVLPKNKETRAYAEEILRGGK